MIAGVHAHGLMALSVAVLVVLEMVLVILGLAWIAFIQNADGFLSAWFIRNFQKTLKWPTLALPKSYNIFNKTVRCTEEFRIRNLGQSCL